MLAQQPKLHHYESFALGGLCHHLQTTKAVNLSLSQLQKHTGQWEISKIPESPFGTVNSELSASDPLLLENETTTSKLISTCYTEPAVTVCKFHIAWKA